LYVALYSGNVNNSFWLNRIFFFFVFLLRFPIGVPRLNCWACKNDENRVEDKVNAGWKVENYRPSLNRLLKNNKYYIVLTFLKRWKAENNRPSLNSLLKIFRFKKLERDQKSNRKESNVYVGGHHYPQKMILEILALQT